jgi:hypothetical protein
MIDRQAYAARDPDTLSAPRPRKINRLARLTQPPFAGHPCYFLTVHFFGEGVLTASTAAGGPGRPSQATISTSSTPRASRSFITRSQNFAPPTLIDLVKHRRTSEHLAPPQLESRDAWVVGSDCQRRLRVRFLVRWLLMTGTSAPLDRGPRRVHVDTIPVLFGQ